MRSTDPADIARNAEIMGQPPRIAPLAQDAIPAEVRAHVDALYAGVGVPPSKELSAFHSTLAKSPELMRAHLELGTYLFKGKLPVRDRELAILRLAWLTRTPIEWGEHVKVFKRLGRGTDTEVRQIIKGSSDRAWNDHERAVLRGVEELKADAMISDATWATLARSWTEQQLLEFPILVGKYVSVSYALNSLRIRLEHGNPGLTAR